MNITKIDYNFNGKNISSEAGSLSLAWYTQKIRLKESLKSLDKGKNTWKRWPKYRYSKSEVCYQEIMWYMKGYSTTTDISKTINDPFITEVLKEQIPSQSTFSRTNTGFTKEDEKIFKKINKNVIDSYFWNFVEKNNGNKIERIDISDDSTKIQTYGKQEWSDYIYHYGVVGYHPDLITEDNKRLILTWVLRDGNTYSSKGSEKWLWETIENAKEYTEKIVFRGDSAYGNAQMLNMLNEKQKEIKIEYFIKAKTYRSWLRNADIRVEYKRKLYHPLELPKEYFEEINENGDKIYKKRYFEFKYKVNTWKQKEKIVAQIRYRKEEKRTLFEEQNKDVELLIVNSKLTWEEAFKEYGKRGKQEQIIEEFKNECFGKNLSLQWKTQNSCIFLMKIISYNLMQILRLETLYDTRFEKCRVSTMRRLLVRIWWRIVKHWRKTIIKLSSSFAYKKRFELVMARIDSLTFSLI